MLRLLIIVLTAATLWAGYWVVGSIGADRAMTSWLNDRRTDGWQADYSDLSVAGFPNRFDTTITDVALADPKAGWAWTAPFFQILTLSYKPNHLIAAWPNTQTLQTPLGRQTIQSTQMQASLVVDAGARLPLNRTNFIAHDLVLTPDAGEPTAMKTLRAAIQRLEGTNTTYRFAITADEFAPGSDWRGLLDPKGALPKTLSALSADITVAFDAPWDLNALESKRPQPTQITVKLAEGTWGALRLATAGDLAIDENGVPSGRITIKARNWRDILAMAVTSGTLSTGMAAQAERGLSLLATMSGNPETLDIPLDMGGGFVRLGPIPIATSPVFKLR